MADFPKGSPPFLLAIHAGSIRAGRRVPRAKRLVTQTMGNDMIMGAMAIITKSATM